jgi:hypothetical protein
MFTPLFWGFQRPYRAVVTTVQRSHVGGDLTVEGCMFANPYLQTAATDTRLLLD